LINYEPEVWRDLILKFIEEIVRNKCVVVGNSLGGYSALYAAATSCQNKDDLICEQF
jgi:pimeloyl-ACP methyl ester carboxylesterase